ncbi:hypothetical protein ZWY2020_017214 [Hordeum vulgare]|nr:hypothetical protein ZWY2020_017214 [Hordeum vulgare]
MAHGARLLRRRSRWAGRGTERRRERRLAPEREEMRRPRSRPETIPDGAASRASRCARLDGRSGAAPRPARGRPRARGGGGGGSVGNSG